MSTASQAVSSSNSEGREEGKKGGKFWRRSLAALSLTHTRSQIMLSTAGTAADMGSKRSKYMIRWNGKSTVIVARMSHRKWK